MRQQSDKLYPGCEYSDEERLWLRAVDEYKRLHRRLRLLPADVLAIAHALGYRKRHGDGKPAASPVPGGGSS